MRAIGLRGDAGVGKSRLIAEWTGALSSQGVDVLMIRAMGYASTRPTVPPLTWLRIWWTCLALASSTQGKLQCRHWLPNGPTKARAIWQR